MSRRAIRYCARPRIQITRDCRSSDANLTDADARQIGRIAEIGSVASSCAGAAALCRRAACAAGSIAGRRPPLLTHPSGRTVADLARRDRARDAARKWHPARLGVWRPRALHHLPHSGDKGPRALARAGGLEAKALARIGATPGMRLACQICPTADISVMPLLAADAERRRRRGARRARGQRAADHRGVRRPARLDHAGRSQAALRRAVHSQPVLPRDDARRSPPPTAITRNSPATG